MIKTPISRRDSHITEPPNCYVDYIDPAFRERAPRIHKLDKVGDAFVIEGMSQPVPMGLLAAAGKEPAQITTMGVAFEDLWPSGWNPKYRLADQDRDGVGAEFIYPTVGMLLCNHPDFDFKKACFEDPTTAGWPNTVRRRPTGCAGLAQVSMRTPEDGVAELKAVKAMGFKGVMMPGDPAVEDYDHPIYDQVWATAVELGLPLSFHILTTKSGNMAQNPRGPRINSFMSVIRGYPGHHGHADLLRRLRPPSEAEDRLRRGRRRLGAALHLPHGPRLQPPSLLDEGAAAESAAERIFRRAHLCHLPGRLGGVQDARPVQCAPADVGQ